MSALSRTWGRWWLWAGRRGLRWSASAVHRSPGFYWGTPAGGRHWKQWEHLCKTPALSDWPPFLTMFPVKVTGGDCQEMLKVEPLVGAKLAQPLLLLDGMDTGAVAWGGGQRSVGKNFPTMDKSICSASSEHFKIPQTYSLKHPWNSRFIYFYL